jgi:Fic-DOC domain mobile mystery protein B
VKLELAYPEGATPLDPNETQGLKHKHISTQDELNELEQANIDEGRLWLSRLRKPDILTCGFTLEFHKRLFGDVWDWAGTMRRTNKNVGNTNPVDIAVRLQNLVDDAKAWIEYETYPAKQAAIIFHHKLVRIHVFPNGNGRHSRLMADALLERIFRFPPIDWTSGTDLRTNSLRRTQYIAALKAADQENYRPLLAFVGIDS